MKNYQLFIFLLLFSSCARTIDLQECVPEKLYGFWGGLWHGFISLFSLVISFFMEDITIFAVNNTGIWYNVGFVLGVALFFGGGASRR